MIKYICILLLITGIFCGNLHAQHKFEKESRIRQKDVPSGAIQFLNPLQINKKIKWYKEEGLSRNSIEAKFIHQSRRYSVEFDTTGEIEDIEIEVNLAGLKPEVKDSICSYLKKDCLKFTIEKIQIQFTGDKAELFSKINDNNKNKNLTARYELIVKCRAEKSVDLYEYLFDDAGVQLSFSRIVFKNSSHLEY